jgi:hypothetical protein
VIKGRTLFRFPPLALFVFLGSGGVMASSGSVEADLAAAGTPAPVRDLSIRPPDLTSQGIPQGGAGSSSAPGDRVAEMFGRLNLTSQEAAAFVLEEEDEAYPGCPEWALVGKVLAPNPLHITTIRAVLKAAWGNPRGMDIHSVGVNLFLAEFARKVDLDRVKEGSPWKMSNNHGILLKDFDPAVKPSDVYFDRLSI